MAPLASQQRDEPFTTVFYKSGSLRIQAYLYKPDREGAVPLIIYNHGSRKEHERESVPFRYIGNLLTRRGYAVLVPERRGYGQSDGRTYYEEVGNAFLAVLSGSPMIGRLQAETDDVLAALDYVKTLDWVDQNRLGVMGWSFGGIVTMFAASRTDRIKVAVDQAGGALTWPASPSLQRALKEAAQKTKIPVLFMDAKNDRTTNSVTELAKILTNNGTPNKLILYDAFKPKQNPNHIAPGHLIFSVQGYSIWQDDVGAFFDRYLRGSASR